MIRRSAYALAFMFTLAPLLAMGGNQGVTPQRPERLPESLSIDVTPNGAHVRYVSSKETIEVSGRTINVSYSRTALTIVVTDGSASFRPVNVQPLTRTFQRFELSFEGGSLKNSRLVGPR